MDHDRTLTIRRVSPDAFAEFDELADLLRQVRPEWTADERLEAVLRAFGWPRHGPQGELLRLYAQLRERGRRRARAATGPGS